MRSPLSLLLLAALLWFGLPTLLVATPDQIGPRDFERRVIPFMRRYGGDFSPGVKTMGHALPHQADLSADSDDDGHTTWSSVKEKRA